MRVSITLSILLCSLLGPGCTLCTDCAHQVSKEAVESVDQYFERARDRRWAETVWELTRAANPQINNSDDYACGFKDGFVDYLFAGGESNRPCCRRDITEDFVIKRPKVTGPSRTGLPAIVMGRPWPGSGIIAVW